MTKIFDEVEKLVGIQSGSSEKQKFSLNLILQKISENFTPLVPAIAAAGLIKGLLAAAAKFPMLGTL